MKENENGIDLNEKMGIAILRFEQSTPQKVEKGVKAR